MSYGFIYLTTNKVNGRKYVGRKKGDPSKTDYLGSGKALKSAIQKYGKDNFERVTLEFTLDREDHEAKEEKWLKILNASDDPSYYNLIPFSHGGHLPGMTKGQKRSLETKAKMSESLKERWKNPEYREAMSLKSLGRPRSEETKRKIKESKASISEETRLKISEAAKKRPPRSSEIQEKISKSNTGKKRSEETKRRMSEARKEFWRKKKELI
uniref:Homing endonuclease n=1 Tax=Ochrobactrum phage ORM_20 TaxID=2985243 RepID=A0A9N6WTW7_9VIRU|nr:homing endonuclease [Ochrobactrum phage ORM_20]